MIAVIATTSAAEIFSLMLQGGFSEILVLDSVLLLPSSLTRSHAVNPTRRKIRENDIKLTAVFGIKPENTYWLYTIPTTETSSSPNIILLILSALFLLLFSE